MDDFFVHETAVVDAGVHIGTGTKVWHFSHIMSHCTVGVDCVIGQNVFLGASVK
ncbi:N-acetyltransferase, partial [Schleiferiaceae bacterium]|nr:N-acetyltransferase [Schleiferiaceae bacterium]